MQNTCTKISVVESYLMKMQEKNSRPTTFKVPDFQPRVQGSKPQGGSKVKSAFHVSDVD